MGVSPLVSLRQRFNFRGWIWGFWKGCTFTCGGQMKEFYLKHVPGYSLGQGPPVPDCWGFHPGQTGVSSHMGLRPGGVELAGAPASALSLISGAALPEMSSQQCVPKLLVFPARKTQLEAAVPLPCFGRFYWCDSQAKTSSFQQRCYLHPALHPPERLLSPDLWDRLWKQQ